MVEAQQDVDLSYGGLREAILLFLHLDLFQRAHVPCLLVPSSALNHGIQQLLLHLITAHRAGWKMCGSKKGHESLSQALHWTMVFSNCCSTSDQLKRQDGSCASQNDHESLSQALH